MKIKKNIAILVLILVSGLSASAAPELTNNVYFNNPAPQFHITSRVQNTPDLRFFTYESAGNAFDASSYTCKFMWATEQNVSDVTGMYTLTGTSSTTGCVFEVRTNFFSEVAEGGYCVLKLTKTGEAASFAIGKITIVAAPEITGTTNLTPEASTEVDWIDFDAYSNTADNGPYRAGTNVTFSSNTDGSVDIDVAQGANASSLTGTLSTAVQNNITYMGAMAETFDMNNQIFNFGGDDDTTLRQLSDDVLLLRFGSTVDWQWSGQALSGPETDSGQLRNISGDLGICFTGDGDTGLKRLSANTMGIIAGSTTGITVNTSGVTLASGATINNISTTSVSNDTSILTSAQVMRAIAAALP